MKYSRIDLLLEELEDFFVHFPIQSVTSSLQGMIDDTYESFCVRMGPDGVARRYWDEPAELLHEEIGVLMGGAFVLGQAAITQTLSIIEGIRPLAGSALSLPQEKYKLLRLEVPKDERSGFSHPEIIAMAANYFKHHHEWPEHWSNGGGDHKNHTIKGCVAMGMRVRDGIDGMPPRGVTENLCSAVHALGSPDYNVQQIQRSIEIWRTRLAAKFYADLGMTRPSNFSPT